jgi:hypothetical protein
MGKPVFDETTNWPRSYEASELVSMSGNMAWLAAGLLAFETLNVSPLNPRSLSQIVFVALPTLAALWAKGMADVEWTVRDLNPWLQSVKQEILKPLQKRIMTAIKPGNPNQNPTV